MTLEQKLCFLTVIVSLLAQATRGSTSLELASFSLPALYLVLFCMWGLGSVVHSALAVAVLCTVGGEPANERAGRRWRNRKKETQVLPESNAPRLRNRQKETKILASQPGLARVRRGAPKERKGKVQRRSTTSCKRATPPCLRRWYHLCRFLRFCSQLSHAFLNAKKQKPRSRKNILKQFVSEVVSWIATKAVFSLYEHIRCGFTKYQWSKKKSSYVLAFLYIYIYKYSKPMSWGHRLNPNLKPEKAQRKDQKASVWILLESFLYSTTFIWGISLRKTFYNLQKQNVTKELVLQHVGEKKNRIVEPQRATASSLYCHASVCFSNDGYPLWN